MSTHYVKAVVRIGGKPVAAFIMGDWKDYGDARLESASDFMATQLDVIADTVARMKLVPRDTVSVDTVIVYSDSRERAL